MASIATLALYLFLALTLISSTVLARPFTDDELLQKFMNDNLRQPIAYSNFDDSDPIPYRAGIKRQMQAFGDPTSNMSKLRAMNILRSMVNFRRY